jgi:signal transduction histidine kinase
MTDPILTISPSAVAATPDFSHVERMFLPVLADVRDRLVRPIIRDWSDRIGEAGDTETAHQVAAALLFPVDPLRPAVENERSRLLSALQRGVWSLQDRALLKDLLSDHGHLLFNSYCYTTVAAFGDYHLVPLLLGYRPDDAEASRRAARHIAIQELPFHLNAAYISTYEQLLSCSAGITPFGLRLFAAGKGTPTENIPNFLGDLAILYKREDYVQGHLAALVGFLGPRSDDAIPLSACAGAFVVTSIVPGAFDAEHENILSQILQRAWAVGFVRSESQPTSIYARGVAVMVTSPSGPHPLEQEFKVFMRDSLSHQVRRSLLVGRIEVSAAGEQSAVATAVNLEAVERFFRAQFPTGPHYTRLSPVGDVQDVLHVVDPAALTMTASLLQAEVGDSAATDEWRLTALSGSSFLEALRCLVPETLEDPRASLRAIRLNEHARLLIVKAPSDTVPNERAIDALRAACIEATAAARLPDGENTVFAAASDLWHLPPSKRAESARHTSQTAGDIAARLVDLFRNGNVRAVFVVGDSTLFRTDATTLPPAFAQAYLAYPSYWMFERLNRLLTADLPPLEAFHRAGVVVPELIPNDRLPVRTPRKYISADDASDPEAATLLTFLGLPTTRVHEGSHFTWGSPSYRTYLRQTLHDAQSNQGVQRAFRLWKHRFAVEAIDVDEPSDDGALAHYITIRYADRTEEKARVEWSPMAIPTIEAVWLNQPALLQSWSLPTPTPRQSVTGEEQGIRITTDFSGYPVALEPEDLGSLAANVARMHLARLYAEADAARRAAGTLLQSFLHDLRTPLANSHSRISSLVLPALSKVDELLQLFATGGISDSEPCFDATARLREILATVPNDLTLVEENITLVLELLEETAAEFHVRARMLEKNLTWFQCRLMAERVQLLHGLAASNKELAMDVQCDPIEVLADRQAIASIFRNLVSNAINFTARGGLVAVQVLAFADEEWHIVVTNGPIGDAKHGSGLGLDIVRELLTLHHGDLRELDRDGMRVYEAVLRTRQRSTA